MLAALAFMLACTAAPERQVHASTIVSRSDPMAQIILPDDVTYLGADRWLLFGADDCELHLFVEADAHKTVRRLFWVQFERYLPARPDLHHRYNSPRHARIAGLDFYVDGWTQRSSAVPHPDSDSAHMLAILRAKGYRRPPAMMYLRLVHLLDPEKRKELMIIYAEDLAPTGYGPIDLSPVGRAWAAWPKIEDGLLKRALAAVKIRVR